MRVSKGHGVARGKRASTARPGERAVSQRMLLEPTLIPVEGLDLKVGIHPDVLRLTSEGQSNEARHVAQSLARDRSQGTYHGDGVSVIAGPSWSLPFKDEGAEEV